MTRNIILIGVMAAATILTRFLPFLLFPAGKKTPSYVEFLGRTLPFATIGLLTVYCLKGSFMGLTANAGFPEFLAAGLIIVLHKWKGNSLLSIGVGTAFYMVLVQFVF